LDDPLEEIDNRTARWARESFEKKTNDLRNSREGKAALSKGRKTGPYIQRQGITWKITKRKSEEKETPDGIQREKQQHQRGFCLFTRGGKQSGAP